MEQYLGYEEWLNYHFHETKGAHQAARKNRLCIDSPRRKTRLVPKPSDQGFSTYPSTFVDQ